jgi:hypothetical protein
VGDISRDGPGEGIVRFLPVAAASALASVSMMRLVPALAFLFAVPLFFAFFRFGKRAFAISVALSFILDFAAGTVLGAIAGGQFSRASIPVMLAGSAFFTFPLLTLALPERIRARYRVALVGILTSTLWIAFLFATGNQSVVTDFLRATADEVSEAFKPYIPSGYDGALLGIRFSPESVYDMLLKVTLYTAFPMPVIAFTLNAAIARRVSDAMRGIGPSAVDLAFFRVDPFLFYPFAAGLCGIMAAKLFDLSALAILSWNVTLLSGFYFLLQGLGIFRFMGAVLSRKARMARFFAFLFIVLAIFAGFLPHFAVLLTIVGVLELFVPMRARFLHTDADHPTPGPGGGNQ